MTEPGSKLDALIHSLLDDRRTAHQLRTLMAVHPLDATHVQIQGRRFVNFCSNNYLGLTHHPRVIEAVESAVRQRGFGSGAAGLICGYSDIHAAAAQTLAEWKQTEAAVLLPSGYQANLAAVQTLAALGAGDRRPVRFLVDKLVHASILDAVKVAGGSVRVFPHNHLPKLDRLLSARQPNGLDVVVTESIFSMDGDAADLRALAALKTNHEFTLLLDDAHGGGVYGPDGAGYAHELGLHGSVDISIATLSKALGGMGGAICASRAFCEAVLNFGRAFIYTTNLPHAAAAAAIAAIGVMRDEPALRRRLRELAVFVRQELSQAGDCITAGDSPIICVKIGSEADALAAAAVLREEGLLVMAVRPPTVAPGSSRLRVTLCSGHGDEEIARLLGVLKRIDSARSRGPDPRAA